MLLPDENDSDEYSVRSCVTFVDSAQTTLVDPVVMYALLYGTRSLLLRRRVDCGSSRIYVHRQQEMTGRCLLSGTVSASGRWLNSAGWLFVKSRWFDQRGAILYILHSGKTHVDRYERVLREKKNAYSETSKAQLPACIRSYVSNMSTARGVCAGRGCEAQPARADDILILFTNAQRSKLSLR